MHLQIQKVDALPFLQRHFLLQHATLRVTCTRYDKLAVTIAPPSTGPSTQVGAVRRSNRRVDEVVTLTEVGAAALLRPGSSRRKKQPARDTVVWCFWFQCAGTARCLVGTDGLCPCQFQFYQTPALNELGRVRIIITGRHHPTIPWVPPVLAQRKPRAETKDVIRSLGAQRIAAADIQGELNRDVRALLGLLQTVPAALHISPSQ